MATSEGHPPVNYWRYESDGLGVTVSMAVIATLSVVLRFYSRAKQRTGFRIDDWMILPALISFYGFEIIMIWEVVKGGFGFPPAELPAPYIIYLLQSYYIAPIFSVPAISFAKISILCLYYRIFTVSDTFRKWALGVGATVILWMIACTLTTLLHCIPPKAVWDPKIGGRCVNFILFFEIIEPINCVQDVVIAVMPITVISQLKLDLKQKLSCSVIFVLGSFVAVISLIRIVLIASPTAPADAIHTSNKWLCAQLCIAILCANMLTYRPLLPKRVLPNTLSTWLNSLLSSRSRRSTQRSTERYRYAPAWPANKVDRNGDQDASLTFDAMGADSFNDDRDYPLHNITVSRTHDVV